MADLRERERQVLDGARWVDPGQGRLQVPLEVAIDVVSERGVAPEVVGGDPAAARAPGALPPATPTPQAAPAPAPVPAPASSPPGVKREP